MRQATQTLKDHLALGLFTVADLLTIRLGGIAGTTEYLLTNAPRDLVYDGDTYVQTTFKLGRAREGLELEVDAVEIDLGNPTLGGKKLSVLVHTGLLDRAWIVVERLFMQPDAAPIEALPVFEGEVAGAEPSATAVKLTAKSVLGFLEEERPLRVVQAACPWVLYGAACGVDPAGFTTTHEVQANPTKSGVTLAPVTAVTKPGFIRFTSGENAGVVRAIRSNAAGTLTLAVALPFTPAEGDTVDVLVGCPKTREACLTVFDNLDRFGGCADAPRTTA